MRALTVSARGLVLGLAVLLFPSSRASAELIRIEIKSKADVLDGKSFGDAGAYEKIWGRAYFAVDPANARNKVITDIALAPRNKAGKVEFSADVFILKPKDLARGNGVAFFDVVNRGRFRLLTAFSDGDAADDPTKPGDFGDASLLNAGYTLIGIGWQFDVPPGLIGLQAPVAGTRLRPVKGWAREWFIPSKASDTFQWTSGNATRYVPAHLDSPNDRLTSREGLFSARRLVPRSDWQFAKQVEGKTVPDPDFITLKGGFKPGLTYELAFESVNPAVAGLGLAAVRDLAAALKYEPRSIAPSKFAYMYGSSQTGRTLREIIYRGFTIDEQGRKVFDAAFIRTGGASMGRFNERFAQTNGLGVFVETQFPFQYQTTVDPVTGKSDGMGARIPKGLEPKIFMIDSSSEYWDKGRLGALRHTSIDGTEDQPDAANVRVYSVAGSRHGSGTVPAPDGGGQFKNNTLKYEWVPRALLPALDAWVRKGTEPPASRHPRFADGTMVLQPDLKFPAVPGVQWPTHVPGGYRWDVETPYAALPFPLSNIDADGNETGGIRLPEQAVPLATLTGWQFRNERTGASKTLVTNSGAYIPFARTRAEREKTGDPRLSIEERYATKAEYLAKVEEVAKKLAHERYILTSDIPEIVEDAGRHWDWRMSDNK